MMYANYKRLTKKYSLLWSCATSHQIYWEKQQKMFSFTFFFYLWILQYDSSPLIHANRKQRKKSQFSAHTVRIIFSIPPDRRITLIIFYHLGFCASKENAVCCDVTVTLNHVWASRRNAGDEWKYEVLTAFIGRLMRARGTRALHQPDWQPFTYRCPPQREREWEWHSHSVSHGFLLVFYCGLLLFTNVKHLN